MCVSTSGTQEFYSFEYAYMTDYIVLYALCECGDLIDKHGAVLIEVSKHDFYAYNFFILLLFGINMWQRWLRRCLSRQVPSNVPQKMSAQHHVRLHV